MAKDAHMEKSHLILEYPHSAVLYLRHNNVTPDNMMITIKTPGGGISYKVPIIKMQKYSLEEIFEKNLLFLIPFCIFNYEKEFPLMENGNENFQKAEKEFTSIIKQLNNICLSGEISEYTKPMLLGMQRLNAIISFVLGEFGIEYNGNRCYFDFMANNETFQLSMSNDERLKKHEKGNILPKDLCLEFCRYQLPAIITGQDNTTVDMIFSRINSTGRKICRIAINR